MMTLEMRDEGKKRRRSTAIPESSQDLPSEKKIKGKERTPGDEHSRILKFKGNLKCPYVLSIKMYFR